MDNGRALPLAIENPNGALGCGRARDCTLLRREEERLARLADTHSARQRRFADAVNHLAEGFVIFDAEDRLVACNDRLRDFYPGIAHLLRPGVAFRHIATAFTQCEDISDGATVATLPQRPMRNIELQACRGRWLLINEHRMADGGIVGIHTDITDLKRREAMLRASEEEVRRARDLAEAASRSKSQFLANVSHELRTPLNAILGFTETMRMEIFGPVANQRYSDYLGHVHESAAHLLALINDLLDLSKLEAGRMELHEEAVDPAELVEAAARLVEEQAARKDIAIDVAIDPRLPRLLADERRLRQVVINLLSNAVKFTPRGGRVTVRAGRDPLGVAMTIADNGTGMTPEEIEIALEPFGQGHAGRQETGTGLGLPLARRLARLHGGELAIDSTPGAGTTVTVTLPAARLLA